MARLQRAGGVVLAGLVVAAAAPGCEQLVGLNKFYDALCAPGEKRACYGGPSGTEGVGICRAGTQTCREDGQAWGDCMGEVRPEPVEDCSRAGDENCDGKACSDVIWSSLYGGDMAQATLNALAVDGAGNIFLGGTFQGTMALGGTKLTAASMNGDGFLAKIKPDGTPTWAKSFDGTSIPQRALVADGSGRVSIAGVLSKDLDFGCGTTKAAAHAVFVTQYDGSGACLWSDTFTGTGSINMGALAVDPKTSDVVFGGSFTGSADFGSGTVQTLDTDPNSYPDYDIFLTRIQPGPTSTGGGTVLWGNAYGGMVTADRWVAATVVNDLGDTIVIGRLNGDLTTSFGPVMPNTAGGLLYGIVDASGKLSNARVYDVTDDVGTQSAVVDPTGKPLFAGYFTGTVDFGNGPLMSAGPGDKSTFLVKVGQEGPLFSKMWGDSSVDGAGSVATDKDANIVLAGATLGTINFGGMDLSDEGNGIAYLAKLTPAAKHIWSKGFGDLTTMIWSNPLAVVDPATQQVILGLSLTGSVDFGKGKLTAQGQNIALAKFNP